MTEHALLYAIAIATGISALAWIVVVIGGIKLAREFARVERELREDIDQVMGETLPLLREVRGTVSEVHQLTRSSREIAEEVVSGYLLRRLTGRWTPTRKTAKVGASLARQGVSALRAWLRTRHEAELREQAAMESEAPTAPEATEEPVE